MSVLVQSLVDCSTPFFVCMVVLARRWDATVFQRRWGIWGPGLCELCIALWKEATGVAEFDIDSAAWDARQEVVALGQGNWPRPLAEWELLPAAGPPLVLWPFRLSSGLYAWSLAEWELLYFSGH